MLDADFAPFMVVGSERKGKIVSASVAPYTFEDKDGKTITATTAPIVCLGDESLETAIRKNGKQPAVAVAAGSEDDEFSAS
jgi:hypothetical protein